MGRSEYLLAFGKTELIALYWDIGRQIVERQDREGWGKSIVDRLAADLQNSFPGIGGFSASNVSRMRAFFLAYGREPENSAQSVPKLRHRKSAQLVPKINPAEVARGVREWMSIIPLSAGLVVPHKSK